ncbi:hypothetical protein HDV00_011474 [Rhizophlyctis rosea]|nr:hypothetical protein HDV00_011474 [Rhizophlyctis rosea]
MDEGDDLGDADMDAESMVGNADDASDSGFGSAGSPASSNMGGLSFSESGIDPRDVTIVQLVMGLREKRSLTTDTLNWFRTKKAQADNQSIILKETAPQEDCVYEEAWNEAENHFAAFKFANDTEKEGCVHVKRLRWLSAYEKATNHRAVMIRGVQSFLRYREYQALKKLYVKNHPPEEVVGVRGKPCTQRSPHYIKRFHAWIKATYHNPKNYVMFRSDQLWGDFIQPIGCQYLLLGGETGGSGNRLGTHLLKDWSKERSAALGLLLERELKETALGRELAEYAPLVEEVLEAVLSGRIINFGQ